MTVKALSEFTGKTERSIQRWIKKASITNQILADKMSLSNSTNPADYTIDEVEEILSQSSLGVNAVCIVMANARRNDVPAVISNDQSAITALMQAQQQFMLAVLDKLDSIGSVKQISAPAEDRYTLVGYTSLNHIKTNRSELSTHGRYLKTLTKERSLTVTTVPDERWGKVNSYPTIVLDEYFKEN